ncbi:MAG: response regulator, partial [Burkholderiaceae bacterium]
MIRLLISDDSAFMRIAIRKMVEPFDDIQVVGEARTGQMAVEMAENLKPDVITMDVEMPVMDGLEATKQIMARAPTPIIMCLRATIRVRPFARVSNARRAWRRTSPWRHHRGHRPPPRRAACRFPWAAKDGTSR